MTQVLYSQLEMATILGVTSDAVGLQIKKLKSRGFDVGETQVRESRKEGRRDVVRMIMKYPAATLRAVATRQCGTLAVTDDSLIPDVVVLRPEIHFGELMSCLTAAFAMRTQHPFGRFRVDFYFPDAMLVVEYDEESHAKTQDRDRRRQAYIEERFGVTFIRVKEGKEIVGFRKVIGYLFRQRGLAAGTASDC